MRKKPKIKYTEMCIYIDNNIYNPNHDVEKIFDYLQMLFYALSFKKRMFNTEQEYDDFSLFASTCVYMRLTNKRQFLPDDDPKKMNKIKSVLNYIKRTLYPLKVSFQQENYRDKIDNNIQGNNISDDVQRQLSSDVRKSMSGLLQIDMDNYLQSIPALLKDFINQTPYANDKCVIHNLYISCLLTLLRTITLSNYNYERLMRRTSECMKDNTDELLSEMLNTEKLNAPIAWHLDEGMDTYVSVISTKLQKLMTKDIREMIQYYEPSDEVIKDILMSPLSELNEDDND